MDAPGGQTSRRDRWLVALIAVVTALLIAYNLAMYYGPSFLLKGKEVVALTLFDAGSGVEERIAVPAGTVLLHFWATWCSSCIAELPLLQEYAGRVTVIGVLKAPVRADHLRDLAVPWRNYRGPDGAFDDFMVTGVPVTVLLRDRAVAAVQVGPLSREVLDRWLAASQR